MDIEKLIRRLRNDADAYRNGETLGRAFADQEDVLDKAATALSTLQAENEKLRAELERATETHEKCTRAIGNTHVQSDAKKIIEEKPSLEEAIDKYLEIKKKEANMDKPRICEVLGVEVGERFRPKHLYNGFLSIKENGAVEFDGDPSVKDISNLILWLVCHPEDIVRIDGEKPHFTQQEVERAKAIRVIYPTAYRLEEANPLIRVWDKEGKLLAHVDVNLFLSLKPEQSYTLEEIIGGASDAQT